SHTIRVFVSSTAEDLKAERAEVAGALRRMGVEILMMEDWGSNDRPPLNFSLQRVREADILVLILGNRYGAIPPGTNSSFVHAEYSEALDNKIPVLVYIADEKSYPPPRNADPRLELWKKKLKDSHVVSP